MFNHIPMKKIVLGLFIIMIASFSIAACISSYTGGFSLIKQSTIDVDETRRFSIDGLSKINVDCSSPNVRIIPVDGSEIIVHLHGKSSPNRVSLDTSVAGESLLVKVQFAKTFIINLSKADENLQLDVSVPQTYTSDILAGTSSGNTTVEGLTLDKLIAETSSGNLYLKSFASQNCQLRSSSGNINVENGTADQFRSETSSGDILLSDLLAKSSVLSSSSGSITANRITGHLKAASSSGDVFLEYMKFENNIDVSTSSGIVSLRLPQGADFTLDAKSSSGLIRNTFPLSGYYDRNHMAGNAGSGVNKINLVTASGDITINT